VSQVLGKITAPEREGPSGPDVMHRIEVPEVWFEEGAHLEIELPQRLACARCEGGGCDACGRAGAITLYSLDEEPLVVRVGLPKAPPGGAVVLRIPEGGAPYRSPDGVVVDAAPKADPGARAPAELLRSTEGRSPSPVAGTSQGVAGLLAGKSEPASERLRAPDAASSGDESAPDGSAAPEPGQSVSASDEATSEDPGAGATERELGHRGTLFLRVTAATLPSPGVERAYGVQSAAALTDEERRRLMRRSGLLVFGLVALFLVLLWLSGWL
jgi:hypothetical protein